VESYQLDTATNLRPNEAAFGWASVLSYELDLERRQYLV
jgi:hypothetical protein